MQDYNPFSNYRDSYRKSLQDLKLWCGIYDWYQSGEDPKLRIEKVTARVAEISLLCMRPYSLYTLSDEGICDVFRIAYPNWSGRRKRLNTLLMRHRSGKHPYVKSLLNKILRRLNKYEQHDLKARLINTFGMHQYFDDLHEIVVERIGQGVVYADGYVQRVAEAYTQVKAPVAPEKQVLALDTDSFKTRDKPRKATPGIKKSRSTESEIEDSLAILEFDLRNGRISCGNRAVETGSRMALEILTLLNDNPETYYSAKDLVRMIWGGGVSENTISKHIARARELLEEVASPRRIKLRRGFGWCLPN